MRLLAIGSALCVALSISTLPALAQDAPACAGRSLVEELRERDPARLEAAYARARTTFVNLGARLWRVERPGVAPSLLFGTMHSGDPRIRPLPAELTEALSRASVVALELREIAGDAAEQQRMMTQLVGAAMDYSTDTMASLPEKERELAARGLETRGLPSFMTRSMRPWFLGMMLALPACELRRSASGNQNAVDVQVARGRGPQAELVGLETVAGQIEEIQAMPDEVARHSLIWTARHLNREEDIFATMIELYNRGEAPALIEIAVAAGLATEADRELLLRYVRHVSQSRDATLVARALPHLERGNAVIAVGALHLVGENGLIERFRRAGFTVTAVVE